LQVLEETIPLIKERGHEFVTMDQCLGLNQ